MKFRQLEYFIEVVDCGSISTAAKKLYISQPSLSRIIGALEKEMGKPLLRRSARGVEPTPMGKQMYYYAHSIRDKLLMLERLKGLDGQRLVSRLHITIAGFYLEDDMMLRFYRQLDSIDAEIRFYETNLETALEQVSNQESEIAIVVVNDHQMSVFSKIADAKEVRTTVLAQGPVCLHIHKNHPLAGQTAIQSKDIEQYPNLHLPFDFFSNMNLEMVDYRKSAAGNPRRTITVNNYHIILRMLQHTGAYMIGNIWNMKELSHSDVLTVPLDNISAKQNLVLLQRNREEFSQPARLFLELFLKAYQITGVCIF